MLALEISVYYVMSESFVVHIHTFAIHVFGLSFVVICGKFLGDYSDTTCLENFSLSISHTLNFLMNTYV